MYCSGVINPSRQIQNEWGSTETRMFRNNFSKEQLVNKEAVRSDEFSIRGIAKEKWKPTFELS